MRPEDFSDDAREGAELRDFAERIGARLRAEDRSRELSPLVERVLAETSREDLGRRADLRLVGSYLRERLAQSALLRFAAASLVVHLFAVPVVLAWVMLSGSSQKVQLSFESRAGSLRFEEALPLDLEALPAPGKAEWEEADLEFGSEPASEPAAGDKR